MNSNGTTVSVKGLFANLPVRLCQVSERDVFASLRRQMEFLALLSPNIHFRLVNGSRNKCIMETASCESPHEMFGRLFQANNVLLSDCTLHRVDYVNGELNLTGFFCDRGWAGTNLQFLGTTYAQI
jgi:DNA mismatch repair ATPase MutL